MEKNRSCSTQKQELSFSCFLLLRLEFEKKELRLPGPAIRRAKSHCEELGFSSLVDAAERQRQNSLKPLAVVSQEASWGEGIEKAAAEASSLRVFSLWEKTADFMVWAKSKEPSPWPLQGRKCLTAKTTDVPLLFSHHTAE